MKYSLEILPEELERIERFLSHSMDEAEENAFILALSENPSLREKTEEVRLLLLGVQEAALKEKLQDFHKEIKPTASEKSSTAVFTMKRWLVAASILILAGATAWWFLFNETADEKIYSRYYSPDPGLATVMSNSSSYDFEKAMVEYKNGEYTKALKTWSSLLSEKPGNDTLIYFIGAVNQAMGKDDEAKENLQKLIANANSSFYNDACWYLGLCYLKKGEKKQAIEYIEKSGYPQATDIINAINKE